MREGRDGGAADNVGQHRLSEKRFDHQSATKRLKDHGDVETGTAEAAIGLPKQGTDHAQFGELLPYLWAEAMSRLGDAIPCLKTVLLGDEAVQAVGQHAPFFRVFEVHVLALTVQESSWR